MPLRNIKRKLKSKAKSKGRKAKPKIGGKRSPLGSGRFTIMPVRKPRGGKKKLAGRKKK